jgi:transposase
MTLTAPERMELERRVASRRGRADEARRARCILLATAGIAWAEIRAQLDCSDSYIARWTGRFAAERLAGLYSRHRGQPASKLTVRLEARILEATRHAPGPGATHWSTRRLGQHLGLSHMMVARVWAKHGLKPHRLERYLASDFACYGPLVSANDPSGRHPLVGAVRRVVEDEVNPTAGALSAFGPVHGGRAGAGR